MVTPESGVNVWEARILINRVEVVNITGRGDSQNDAKIDAVREIETRGDILTI
ncbi:hypothetical protein BDV93DRAFT_555841 [Ceratobasidium sp. AG-I]|nr:hypothetical protein BDV93DRAFT_555841 [Ceratobasidium sp. AG-I]